MGYLKGRYLNAIQHWALAYRILDQKRARAKERTAFLEHLVDQIFFIVSPQRYFSSKDAEREEIEEKGIPFDPEELDSVDDVLKRLETGAVVSSNEFTDWI